MDLNFSVFQEPRGVMRILHFIFSICAFATITGFTGYVKFACQEAVKFEYPFNLIYEKNFTMGPDTNKTACSISFVGNFSSDAEFFVATGVLAMLYAIAAMFLYSKFDEMYRTNSKLPLYDFLITVVFGVLWLSSSAAWANSLTGLKYVTGAIDINKSCEAACQYSVSSFSTLNISVVFGFLNFFLWAADLWFLYKETAWFQGANPTTLSGV